MTCVAAAVEISVAKADGSILNAFLRRSINAVAHHRAAQKIYICADHGPVPNVAASIKTLYYTL